MAFAASRGRSSHTRRGESPNESLTSGRENIAKWVLRSCWFFFAGGVTAAGRTQTAGLSAAEQAHADPAEIVAEAKRARAEEAKAERIKAEPVST